MEGSNRETGPSTMEPPKRKFYIEHSIGEMSEPNEYLKHKLTKNERAVHVKSAMDLLLTWPNWDIWPFKISAPVIGMVAAIPGYILNSAFRGALLLGHFGKASSYFATMGVPAATSGLAHNLGVTSDIVEQRTRCPICVQVRSASLLLASGFVYPLLLAPLTSFPIAAGMKNLYFPKIHKQPREVMTFALQVFRSVQNRYLAVGAFQVVVAMGMTYLQQNCYEKTLLPILLGEKNVSKKES